MTPVPYHTAVVLPRASRSDVRPVWVSTSAMPFWNGIFPHAMDRFRSQASLKGRPKPGYDIRAKDDWDGVYDLLAVARTQYQREGGAVGLLRRVRRRAADNVGPVAETARIASKLTPNDSYATPVLGAVEVLLDAVKTAANVRKQVLEGFDGLIPIFSDVELFLGTFPQDHNIWNASVDLTTTTLEAVERAIAFFVSNEFRKGASAIFHGGDYQASLLESLKRIEEKSHSRETQMLQKQILEEQKQMRHEQQQMADGLFNRFNDLLTDHERSRNRSSAAMDLKIDKSPPDPDPLSDRSISWMKQWVHDCSSHHQDSCSQAPGQMPARLIDVTPFHPQLVETHQQHRKYAALSYCWGIPSASNPHLKTLAGNYQQHQNGIPIDTIPKTLHDAILVTRALGIQYLWIDALCIIQDDASDWQQEAVQMGQIYRNAAATIVAATATTSNEGFLARPRDRMHVRIPYTSSSTTSTAGSVKAKDTFQLWQRVTAHLSEDITVQASAWSTRAWTFQEQHLSTRALYFGTHLTHFQCQRDVAAENSAASSVFWPAPWARELGVQDPARAAAAVGDDGSTTMSTATTMHNAWFDIVGDYSARALTVAGDKLPALASMAGAIGDALRAVVRDDDDDDGYHYCAGLWRGDIVRGLLWKGKFDVFDTARLSRPDPGSSYYRAPSWSWAACDGQVHWPARWRDQVRPLCEVVAVETAVANPAGQVAGGCVVLAGKLRGVGDGWPFRAYTEADWEQRPQLSYSHAVVVDGCCVADADLDCGEDDVRGSTTWAFLVASSTWTPGEEDDDDGDDETASATVNLDGLLLQRAEGNAFRRVGLFTISDDGTHDSGFFHSSPWSKVTIV
ncbi:hypothetical protein BK809_0005430 [Diplodia seriata]|uniref:Heterokaryon incompatibility domain-containing protein n=1 Tax=Diplodia seriata TaxID=420778 RepID=A0A1S8BMN1_9PEZI|nr:hypothetical protein BK809_0005430 [Diplodia seriata]